MIPFAFALLLGSDALGILVYPLVYPAGAPLACRADTLLVMGAAQYHGVPSPAFARRLDRALELYEAGCGSRIVVTGGKQPGDVYTEGDSGLRYLHARGVPAAALASETRSTTSFENLAFSRELLRGERLTIVTDDVHAYRARWLARRLGYRAEVAPVATGARRAAYARRELAILGAYHLGLVR